MYKPDANDLLIREGFASIKINNEGLAERVSIRFNEGLAKTSKKTQRTLKFLPIAAVFAALLVISTTVFAATGGFESFLQRTNPPFAEILEPVFGQAESQGILMNLIGAQNFDHQLLMYFSFTDTTDENRVSDTTCIWGLQISQNLRPVSTIIYPQIHFDKETNTSYHKILLFNFSAHQGNYLAINFSELLLENEGWCEASNRTLGETLAGNWQVTLNTENLSDTSAQNITISDEIYVHGRTLTYLSLSPLGLQIVGFYTENTPSMFLVHHYQQPTVYIEAAGSLIPMRKLGGGITHYNFDLQWLTISQTPLNMNYITAIIFDGYRIPV